MPSVKNRESAADATLRIDNSVLIRRLPIEIGSRMAAVQELQKVILAPNWMIREEF